MKMVRTSVALLLGAMSFLGALCACENEDSTAFVRIHNDFDNPDAPRQPPWTICKAYYQGTFFEDPILLGEIGEEREVVAGLDYVYMLCAWNDPDCNVANMVPIATRQEEETVPGQRRTIAVSMPNHQGPCPPQGVQPIPEELYEMVRELWPEYEFKPYADRHEHPQCQ